MDTTLPRTQVVKLHERLDILSSIKLSSSKYTNMNMTWDKMKLHGYHLTQILPLIILMVYYSTWTLCKHIISHQCQINQHGYHLWLNKPI